MKKLKFCTEANQTPLFKRLQNRFLSVARFMVQIFPFTKTKEPLNIQLVPNIWSTSFHQPVKISIGSLVAGASFQLVPKYISKVKVLSKYFTLKQLFPCKMGAKGQIS